MANKNNNSKIYVFRRYKVKQGKKMVRHPKFVVDFDKNNDEFGFLGLTESKKNGKHYNIPLSKNPQKSNSNPAYLRKGLSYDSTNKFGSILKDYHLPEEDYLYIKNYVDTHKKKR